jgi:uncharacterized membrane protein YidH (DUF202 family)
MPRHIDMTAEDELGDPRIYMAAELRTAIALMAFGFVIARFGSSYGASPFRMPRSRRLARACRWRWV